MLLLFCFLAVAIHGLLLGKNNIRDKNVEIILDELERITIVLGNQFSTQLSFGRKPSDLWPNRGSLTILSSYKVSFPGA